MAKKHILCTLNGGGFTQTGGPRLIGCDRHGRTRRNVKKDYAVYGLYLHCWCGHDITRTWSSTAKNVGGDPWVYEVFEKPVCSPERHFSDYARCPSSRGYSRVSGKWELGPVAQCGLHGITYEHCRLCKEALPGMIEGILNGEWKYSPWTIAKRIYSAMK